jgi:hypothetical protein
MISLTSYGPMGGRNWFNRESFIDAGVTAPVR